MDVCVIKHQSIMESIFGKEENQMEREEKPPIVLDGGSLSLEDLWDVVYDRRKVEIAEDACIRVKAARQVLFDLAAEGKPVYGLNHGVGWNKDREFGTEFFQQYNRNLINSHTVGVEPMCTAEEVRAMMCIRLNTALCGCTGISLHILEMYREFLNRGIHPQVFRRGALGEGDVSTLPAVGQAIIGQGEVEYHGKIVPAAEALAAEGMQPAVPGPKDGLSIVSSNAQGESLVTLLAKETEDLITVADAVFCLSLEGLNGGIAPLDPVVNEKRGLPGQIRCAAECLHFLEGSYLHEPDGGRALQDPLSFRCAAAIHGSARDCLDYVERYLELQINRTDDNPCIIPEEHRTSVSPNFETMTLSLGVDMLASAITHLTAASMHRIIKLESPEFSGLPRLLTPDDGRVICFSAYQKTISALNAENRWLANVTTLDISPVAGNIEDHASNLPLAAMRSLKMLDNFRYMLAIELIHGAQAADFRKKKKYGKVTQALAADFRTIVPFLDQDRSLSLDTKKAYEYIRSGRMLETIRAAE